MLHITQRPAWVPMHLRDGRQRSALVQESSRLESNPRVHYATFVSRRDWLQGSNHCPAHGLLKYSPTATYFMKFLELCNHVLDSGESISRHDMGRICTSHALSGNSDPLYGTNTRQRHGCDTSRNVPSGCRCTVEIADSKDQWFKSPPCWNRSLKYVMLHLPVDGTQNRARTISQLMVY